MAVSTAHQRQRYKHQDLWDRFWRDKDGKVVIYQHPNAFLIAWVMLTLASLFTFGKVADALWWVALIDLGVWSLLEIFRGVNYFRRTLGVVVLLMVIASAFKLGL